MDNFILQPEAKQKIIAGIDKACSAIAPTYGAAGGNAVVYEGVYPLYSCVNDAKSILDKIHLNDPYEQQGLLIIKEACDRAEKTSGDGRKTTVLLTAAILRESLNSLEFPINIKKSLNQCAPILTDMIDVQKKLITEKQVGAVAIVSAENEIIGNMLQEIYEKIGKDGIVEIDTSGTFNTTYEIKEGVRLRNAGFLAPYMANQGNEAVYKTPLILITKQKIASLQDLDPLFATLSNGGVSELVIFCDDIDQSVLEALSFTHKQGLFKTLIIKAPTLWKDWLFEDFAAITGATIIDPSQGVSFKSPNIDQYLGSCTKLITTKDETTIIGIKDITAHIEKLKLEGEPMKLRLAWLQTKAAVLKLGANSETELRYLSLKAKDARNASYLALQDGVVAGGGSALVAAAKHLPKTVGGKILRQALKAPAKQIALNAGHKLTIGNEYINGRGFDVHSGKFVNMFDKNIIDPAIVVKNAILNAISVASTALTVVVAIAKPNDNVIQKGL